MSKIVYCLLIVTLATLITARPGDDKKPDAAKDAKGAADKAKAGAEDAAKKPEAASKVGDAVKKAASPPSFGKVSQDLEKASEDGIQTVVDAVGTPFSIWDLKDEHKATLSHENKTCWGENRGVYEIVAKAI